MAASDVLPGGVPHLNTDAHRKVSWLELFYDLVYVATVVQLGNKLSEDVSLEGVLGFVVLFIPIWWVWMGTTFYANRFVADDLTHQLLVFAQIFVVSALAIHVFDGLGETSAGFAVAYAAARGLLVLMYLRAAHFVEVARPLARRYATRLHRRRAHLADLRLRAAAAALRPVGRRLAGRFLDAALAGVGASCKSSFRPARITCRSAWACSRSSSSANPSLR